MQTTSPLPTPASATAQGISPHARAPITATDSALMCESCGYPLAGLEESQGNCPECGTPIADSLPRRRTGSAWQNRGGVLSWPGAVWDTHKGTLLRPRERFRTLRIEPRSGTLLLAVTLPLAGLLLVAPWTGTLVGDPARAARGAGPVVQAAVYALMVPFQAAIAAGILLVLTAIECRGVMFFARRRGWRLTREAAWQVCSHASAGWIVGALVPLFVMAVLWAAPTGRPSLLDKLLARGGGIGVGSFSAGDAVLASVVVGAYVIGLLVFEVLVYVGVRQCRWANPINAGRSGGEVSR
ncbi:MAG: hypothetical protein AMXMBFR58_10100 [Phycisphaerae bacterium]|nr:hypothetical protein [Phycisphaerales bacterium]MCK6475195.1 hypothetical protein [Phycisphaerales bacterium]